jgi:hypothetical protein
MGRSPGGTDFSDARQDEVETGLMDFVLRFRTLTSNA